MNNVCETCAYIWQVGLDTAVKNSFINELDPTPCRSRPPFIAVENVAGIISIEWHPVSLPETLLPDLVAMFYESNRFLSLGCLLSEPYNYLRRYAVYTEHVSNLF